ncbi:TnsD family Tn7-like transposition protein [Paenibacillus sp. FSL R7-0297]|uniref:TnsD family Tn7-like transposition protein n=1 Tax=Paenibacillus sp. FSL R7-0297 TaxID=2921680 RepID=UPI0030F72772
MILLLAYFPTLYEDELLYSGIARYHMNSGNKTQKQTIEDLFGDVWVCASADFPSHIGALVSKIDDLYSSEQLIRDHTLFPYYTHFMSKSRIMQVEMLMKGITDQGAIYANLGLAATKIKTPKYLRFCRECFKAESEICEPYWHRSHQLPGVSICPLHKQPLILSDVECSTENHKFEFVALSKIKEEHFVEVEIDNDWIEHLIYLAEQSSFLLLSSCLRINDHSEYKSLLYEQGYLTPKGRVKFERLINNFRLFYSDELLRYLNCEVTGVCETWLHKIIRTPEEIVHPLRHLLIMKFLGDNTNREEKRSYSPFGDAPWPCLNKAVGHYLLNVIEECAISRCSKTGRPVGTFQCSCGFVYSRTGPDQSYEDKYRIGRIKEFGYEWYEKLKEVNATDSSLRKKAKILGVDPGTIKKQTAMLLSGDLKVSYKKERTLVKKSKPIITTKNLSDKKQISRVNWSERDILMFEVVRRAVEEIEGMSEPHRITLASIARTSAAKNFSLFLKNINNLPKTKNFTQSKLDTTESYQIRRMLWAADILFELEGSLAEWKLLKLAGLNFPLKSRVEDMFNYLTRPYNI